MYRGSGEFEEPTTVADGYHKFSTLLLAKQPF